jgi:nitrogenase molybdenum-iron protein alpha/beta subunit
LASTKLFTENVVMGSEENIANTANGFIEKNRPDVIGILTSGLSEVKGDDVSGIVKQLQAEHHQCNILNVSTPDYEGGLEAGYAKAVEALLQFTVHSSRFTEGQINVLVGSHLTPADFMELREIIESFGLKPIMLPDLSALDGSRQGFSALATGGTKIDKIRNMGASAFTIAIGTCMEPAAMILKERFGIEYRVFESISGLKDADMFMEALSMLSGKQAPAKYERQRRILIDGMRDAHFYYGGKRICIALEPDLSMQTAHWLEEMGAEVFEVDTTGSDLFSVEGDFNLLISNSHAEDTAKRLGVPLYQMGFPVYKILGNTNRVTIGYRGTLGLINDIANLMMRAH